MHTACSKSYEIPEAFKGGFFELDGTQNWICYILQDYVVYDNEFWTYKATTVEDDEIKLTLSNNFGKKQRLKILKQGLQYLVSSSNDTFICNKNGDNNKVKPSSGDPVWEAGIATINGFVYGDTSQGIHVKIEAEKYYSVRESEMRIAKCDENGRFSISIPVLNSQSVIFYYGDNRWRRIFVTPGEAITVLINGENGRPVHFMGKNADVCYHIENILDTLHQIGEVRILNWSLETEAFRHYIDSLANVQQEFLKQYAINCNSSELFNSWCERYIECNRVLFLGAYSYNSTLYGRGSEQRLEFDHPYYSFIHSIDFNDSLILLEANAGDMVGQINNYYQKVLRQTINSTSQIHKDFYELLAEYNGYLSQEDSLIVSSLQDSLTLCREFSNALVNRIMTIADPFMDEYEEKVLNARMDRRIDYFLSLDYSIMRDLILMKVYDDLKQARKFAVLDHVYQKVLPYIKSEKLKRDLVQEYDDFMQRIEKLTSIDMIAKQSNEPGKELLLDIINTYPDTVIILDFWYTACGPCRGDFKKMPSIKEYIYDLPVKYIYLCYSSSENDWRNVVKEFGIAGDHYLLSEAQFAYFANLFQISSAPRYILINRNGEIANDNFPSPTSKDQYKRMLSGYTSK